MGERGQAPRGANETPQQEVASELRRTRKRGKTAGAPGSVMLPWLREVMVPGQLRYLVKTGVYVSLFPEAQ